MSLARKALSRIRWRLPATDDRDAVGDALSPVCRLAIVYLVLPVLVWLLGWFEWWFGVPAAALLAAGLWRALTGRIGDVQAVRRLAVVALPLALGCVMLLPPGGLVDPTGTDWVAHRAVFLDLARGDWPTYLPDYVSNEPPLLRYYLGYFIVPGLIAKWLGARCAALGGAAVDLGRPCADRGACRRGPADAAGDAAGGGRARVLQRHGRVGTHAARRLAGGRTTLGRTVRRRRLGVHPLAVERRVGGLPRLRHRRSRVHAGAGKPAVPGVSVQRPRLLGLAPALHRRRADDAADAAAGRPAALSGGERHRAFQLPVLVVAAVRRAAAPRRRVASQEAASARSLDGET